MDYVDLENVKLRKKVEGVWQEDLKAKLVTQCLRE